MNEATLEARVNAEIQKHFPSIASLRITHQKYLTLRFGHRTDIEIGGLKQAQATGRLDVLLSFDEKPLAILELKAPDKPLTIDDRDQGLAYAKALTSQAPLVILSNGEEAQFFQTYDGKEWTPSNKDEEAVSALFSHSLACAADERNEAIRILLGKQPHIWTSLFQNYTASALGQLEGGVDDYSRPLTREFLVERSIVYEIGGLLIKKEPLLVLVGPPLSGKTNVISQICRASEFGELIPIYIDAVNTSYGIFQHIANQLTRELYVQVQTSEIRQWLLHGIHSIPGHLVIIIDGWAANITGTLKEDIDELISFLGPEQSLSVVLSMDDNAFTEAKTISGRPTCSAIGRSAKVIELNPLDDDEFNSACKMLYDNFAACFHPGAQYNQDYRTPRFLRLLASALNYSGNSFPDNNSQVRMFPSVTSFLVFESWRQFIVNPELEGIFQALAKAYILDRVNRYNDPTLILMSHGKGHIVQATAQEVLGQEQLSKLQSQGHVGIVRGPHGKVLLLPKIPEFLAVGAAYIIADDCLSTYREKGLEEAYNLLVKESDHFPHGDLVGAKALLEISKREQNLAHDLIFKLLEDTPKQSRLTEGSRVLMYFEDVGEINVHFGKGTNERAAGNIHPWHILCQLSAYAVLAYEESVDPLLHILATIGSYPQILIRPYPVPLKQNPGYHVHEIPGRGSVLCHQTGIIETITYAMQRGFYNIPKDMLQLCCFAKEKNLFFLAHRLNMAAISTETCIEKDVARASEEAQKLLRPIVRNVTETTHDICQTFRQEHGKVGRNAPCPCGSGKKYKKCCGR